MLRWEDQQELRKYVEGSGGNVNGGSSSNKASSAPSECAIEVSPTSRATCRNCSQKIMKGEVDASFIKLPLPCDISLLYLVLTYTMEVAL